jgi:hypothetical protein
VGIAVFYGYEGSTAERLEAERELRDTAAALHDALDEYERSLEWPDESGARPSVRGAELRIEFAQRRVQRAAIRARDLIAEERLAGAGR